MGAGLLWPGRLPHRALVLIPGPPRPSRVHSEQVRARSGWKLRGHWGSARPSARHLGPSHTAATIHPRGPAGRVGPGPLVLLGDWCPGRRGPLLSSRVKTRFETAAHPPQNPDATPRSEEDARALRGLGRGGSRAGFERDSLHPVACLLAARPAWHEAHRGQVVQLCSHLWSCPSIHPCVPASDGESAPQPRP